MVMPGFSAEMSLFKPEQTYRVSRITSNHHLQVVPQMNFQCLAEAFLLFRECMGTGLFGVDTCGVGLMQRIDHCGGL
jgi:hypothetical protein